jgi:peptidoglycan/LPS O-acetylase OafA/YrhL
VQQPEQTISQKKDAQERFHFLDGLRGIAASMIVIHHAFSSNIARFLDGHGMHFLGNFLLNFTQSGVDLFFVLSGVVLLRPYLRKERKLKIPEYFKRRIKRIYPPYFFALLFAAVVIWFNSAYPTWYNEKGMRVTFSWLETLKEAVIINFDGKYYNLAWWSLQIEILFYILVPLVIFVFPSQEKINNRRLVFTIFATLTIALLLQLFFTEYFSSLYSVTYYVLTIGKFVEYPVCFLLGVFLATKDFSLRHAWLFMLTGFIFIVSGILLIKSSLLYFSVIHSGFGLVYAGVITLAFNAQSLKKFLSKPGMIWLGERSYSLFLIHFSVFYLTDNIVSHFTSERNAYYGILTRGIGIPMALFAAMLLFYFVERRQARGLLTGNMFWPWQARQLGK